MKGTRGIVRTAAAAIVLSLTAYGQVSTGSHLYTQPDPSAGGGIQGRVAAPARPLVAAYALPPDEPRFVYRGAVGATGTFSFPGLPPSRYDLILVFEDAFYEGLVLSRKGSPMPSGDREAIEDIIGKSEPYYTKKFVHRIEGRGGTGGVARCICTFLRDGSPSASWTARSIPTIAARSNWFCSNRSGQDGRSSGRARSTRRWSGPERVR